ncbi:MAG: hypothetical protein JSV68_16555 [Anaerolineaceae bacterium]|nr:MAG: hypothetical protein JSV68_16555 [Anaerolineaceae bacterium]
MQRTTINEQLVDPKRQYRNSAQKTRILLCYNVSSRILATRPSYRISPRAGMNWHPPRGDEGARACEYNGSPTLQTSLRPHLLHDSVVLTSRAIELFTLITGEYLAQHLAIRIRRLGNAQGKGNSRRQVNSSVALTFAARVPPAQE